MQRISERPGLGQIAAEYQSVVRAQIIGINVGNRVPVRRRGGQVNGPSARVHGRSGSVYLRVEKFQI